MHRLFAPLVLLSLAACGEPELTSAEQEAADDRAIAAVEAAQDIPPEPVEPEAIAFSDIEQNDLFGAGCSFVAQGEGDRVLALAMERGAYIKVEGRIRRLAPDIGSPALPLGARGQYAGKEYAMVLDLAEGEGEQSGTETVDYPSRLELRNGRDQVVFGANGVAQCGS
ncbi:hypothetical protein [Pelagerythrobacter sp.]|uniref:hypothetical protein n=1 Tax=Pelagerythrobacter sp. TaxID=2800702 RepID=UPI0035AD7CD3